MDEEFYGDPNIDLDAEYLGMSLSITVQRALNRRLARGRISLPRGALCGREYRRSRHACGNTARVDAGTLLGDCDTRRESILFL